jgi:uncharacterized protein (DUF4415 family)
MSKDSTGKRSRALATDWKRVREMTDAEVRAAREGDPDVPPTDDAFWEGAKLVVPADREAVTLEIDSDVLSWFRRRRGYQRRINAILRSYMESHGDAAE